MSRVLVCGGRDYADVNYLHYILNNIAAQYNIEMIIEGEARGADSMARDWAVDNRYPVAKYPADWKKYGKAAGHIRNKQMLDEGQPDIVIAFPGGRGTENMVKQATDKGVKVIRVDRS